MMLLSVAQRSETLLWRLVVLLLRITLCLGRLLVTEGDMIRRQRSVGLVWQWHSNLGRVGQGGSWLPLFLFFLFFLLLFFSFSSFVHCLEIMLSISMPPNVNSHPQKTSPQKSDNKAPNY